MNLGAFSISLAVKDLNESKLFYEGLGFEVVGGNVTQNYLILRNRHINIGLFQGMFENNILTFNPGWDQECQELENFDDVRAIQETLKSKGIPLLSTVEENSSGPGSIMLKDPDGNTLLIDQHL